MKLARWTRRLALIAIALVVTVRVALAFAITPILVNLAAGQGYDLRIGGFDATWLGLNLEFRDVRLSDASRPDATPLLEVDYLLVDADVSETLLGSPTIHRVEVDGVRVDLERDSEGRWLLPESAPTTEAQAPATAATSDEPLDDTRAPFALRLPVRVGAVLVQQVRLHVLDASHGTPIDHDLAVEVRVDSLGYEDRPATLELLGLGADWLDLLLLQVELDQREDGGLDIDGSFDLAGLEALRLAPLLDETGVEIHARMFEGHGQLTAALIPTEADAADGPLRVELDVTDVSLEVDLEEQLAVDRIHVEIDHWSEARIEGTRIDVSGPRAHFARDDSGSLRILGTTVGGANTDEPDPQPESQLAEPAATSSPTLFDIGVAVHDGRFRFDDAATPDGSAHVVEVLLNDLDLEGLCWPVVPDSTKARLTMSLSVPESLDALDVQGVIEPNPTGFEASLSLDATGLSGTASRPYLTAVGVDPILAGGKIHVEADGVVEQTEGGVTVEATARGLAIESNGVNVADLGTLTVTGLNLPDAGGARLDQIVLDRIALPIERFADGALELAGVRIQGASDQPPFQIAIEGERIELRDLDFTGDADRPATLIASGRVRGLVESLELDGRIDVDDDGLLADFDLTGDAIDPTGLTAVLARMGLESTFEDGRLSGHLEVRQGPRVEGGDLALMLSDVRIEDGSTELFAVDRLELGPTRFAPLTIGELELSGARLRLERDLAGRTSLLGFAPLVDTPEPAPAALDTSVDVEGFGSDAESAEATTSSPEVAASATESSSDPEPSTRTDLGGPLPIPDLGLLGARMDDVELIFEIERPDARSERRSLTIAGVVEPIRLGADASAGGLKLAVTVDANASLALEGNLLASPDELRADMQVTGRVDDGAELADLLPSTLACTLGDGALDGHVELEVVAAEEGGRSLRAKLDGLRLTDRGGADELVNVESLTLVAPRLDPAALRYAIDELEVDGARLQLARDLDGTLHVAGLAFAPTLEEGVSDAKPASTPSPVNGAMVMPERYPDLRVESIDLGLERVRWIDRAQGPEATPIDLSVRLTNDEPWQLIDDVPEDLPSIAARLELGATPLFERVESVLTVEPFAELPHLHATLEGTGISGAGFEAALPVASEGFEADGLTSGRLSAELDLSIDLRRRHALDLDLRDGFGAILNVDDLELVDAERDERWLALESLRVDVRRIRPDTGDVHITAIEATEPFLRALTRDEAFEFLAIRFPQAPESTAPSTTETAGPDASEASETALSVTVPSDTGPSQTGPSQTGPSQTGSSEVDPSAVEGPSDATTSEVAAAGESSSELRVDQVLINGLDLAYTDFDADPVARIPLEDLDLELRNYTNKVEGASPLIVSGIVTAGTVELPAPIQPRGGMLGGLTQAAMSTLTGNRQERPLEQRPLFRELGLSAQVTRGPEPTGWIRFYMTGFELLALRGLAAKSDIQIGGGLVDTDVRLQLRGTDGTDIQSTTVFERLSLSEPPNGPISRYLKLPAPLDSVLFLLRDRAGRIRLPVDVTISAGRLSRSRLATAITTALVTVISNAVASSPLRVTGALTGLIGLDMNGERDVEPIVTTAAYTSGAIHLDPSSVAALDTALEALRKDDDLELIVEQVLGADDLSHAESLGNPTPEEALELTHRLEEQVVTLTARRTSLAIEIRTLQLVDRGTEATERAEELVLVESRLGLLERAIDNAYRRLRPTSDRRRDQRTREAALHLAELRQSALLERVAELRMEDSLLRLDLRPVRIPRGEPEPTGAVRLSLVRRR